MINLPDPVPYYRLVWEIVKQVPAGKVTTFGQIASMIPPPDGIELDDYIKLAPRWVGDAMNRVSTIDDPDVPWHRVINAKGMISLPELSRGAAIQRGRLRDEGVMDEDSEVVDLDEYGWQGPDMDFLDEHDLLAPKPLSKKKRIPAPKAAAPAKSAAPVPPWEDAPDAKPESDEVDDKAEPKSDDADDDAPMVQLRLF